MYLFRSRFIPRELGLARAEKRRIIHHARQLDFASPLSIIRLLWIGAFFMLAVALLGAGAIAWATSGDTLLAGGLGLLGLFVFIPVVALRQRQIRDNVQQAMEAFGYRTCTHCGHIAAPDADFRQRCPECGHRVGLDLPQTRW